MMNWDEAKGFAILPPVVAGPQIEELLAESTRIQSESGQRTAGVRHVTAKSCAMADLASSGPIRGIVSDILGPGAFLVRSILFDKTPETNWDVPWHQDMTIAVRERVDLGGFGPWSVKAGVVHVRPPVKVLEGMITVRVHLDPCRLESGPLLVAPGTHREGIWREPLDVAVFEAAAVPCHADAGGVVVMRPLLLHASRKAAATAHRRVIHLEYAAASLPAPLEWAIAG